MKTRFILLSIATTAIIISLLFAGLWSRGFFSNSTISCPDVVSYPSLEELVNYTLSIITNDRMSSNLQNVTLSQITSAQQHADDMLKNHYFSHWDTQGYKPYVRYTLAGGTGAVDENLAYQSGPYSNITQSIEELETGTGATETIS